MQQYLYCFTFEFKVGHKSLKQIKCHYSLWESVELVVCSWAYEVNQQCLFPQVYLCPPLEVPAADSWAGCFWWSRELNLVQGILSICHLTPSDLNTQSRRCQCVCVRGGPCLSTEDKYKFKKCTRTSGHPETTIIRNLQTMRSCSLIAAAYVLYAIVVILFPWCAVFINELLMRSKKE